MGSRAQNCVAISDYRQAEHWYENETPIRKTGVIPLGRGYYRKFNDRMRLVKWGQEYACRLYATDVITFKPSGEIVIRPYSSKTTNDFVNTILRGIGVKASFCHDEHSMFWVKCAGEIGGEMRGYSIDHTLTFTRSGKDPRYFEVLDRGHTFEFPRINRERAKAALKGINLSAMQEWINAVNALGGGFPGAATYERYGFETRNDKRRALSTRRIVELVNAGYDGWVEIVKHRGVKCMQEIRLAIYGQAGDVFETEERPYLIAKHSEHWGYTTWKTYQEWRSRHQAYDKYID